jgi:hypothetical protein
MRSGRTAVDLVARGAIEDAPDSLRCSYRHDHLALPRPVALHQEYRLPGAQREVAVADRHGRVRANQRGPQVAVRGRLNGVKPTSSVERSESDGVAVEFVVVVAGIGDEVGEEALEVVPETRLVLVDEHAGGGVAAEDVAGAGVEVRGHAPGDLAGDFDRLEAFVGRHAKRFLHGRMDEWEALQRAGICSVRLSIGRYIEYNYQDSVRS